MTFFLGEKPLILKGGIIGQKPLRLVKEISLTRSLVINDQSQTAEDYWFSPYVFTLIFSMGFR